MFRSTLILIVMVVCLGCSSVPVPYKNNYAGGMPQYRALSSAGSVPDLQYALPDELFITVRIDDYRVLDFTVSAHDINGFPNIKFGSQYSDGHIIVVSFYPSPPQDGSYWLAKIPSIRSGVEVIRARLYQAGMGIHQSRLPPEVVVLNLSIRDGKVVRGHIENASANSIGLRYEKPLSYNGIRFGMIRSSVFPGEIWLFRFPASDGRFNIAAKKSQLNNRG